MIRHLTIPLIIISFSVYPAEKELNKFSIIELEQRWWTCDYNSTLSMLGTEDAAACSGIFEELKFRKFDNNYSKFMDWWKANKDSEYKRQLLKKNP